ncbi:hypothetical protein EB001_03540 [bacterium]|nr:hypothetical protein [bacterium]
MAKDPGLSFKSEQDFAKQMGSTMNPSAFKQVVEQLRTNNLSAKSISAESISAKTMAEPVIKDSKEVQVKKDQLESNEKLIDAHKKLTTNIEKLTKTMANSVLGKANRAEEIAGKQKLDYRGIGQQFKEKIMGRGGDKWDTNSLRYKLGSLRGLAQTTGLVKEGGFIDNKLAVREERLRTATRMTEANAGMENLKQFGSKAAVERYYQRRGKETIKARAGLQSEEYNREKYREAGISDEEYERTTGGKRQVKALAEAGQAVINVDPRLQGEKKGSIKFAGPDESVEDKLNVSQEEQSQLAAVSSNTDATKELVEITRAENSRKEKADELLLAAVKGIEVSGGGALGGLANAASNMVGGKGGILKKGAGYLSKVGGIGKLAKGFGIGAIGALAGEGLQYGGEKLKEAGYEKTGKAVGTAGTAAKYAGYGAMIGSVVPGVGTAIGGAVGGVIGAGKGIYDNYYAASPKTSTVSNAEKHSMRMDTSDPNRIKFTIDGKEVSEEDYMKIQNGPLQDQPRAIRQALDNADKVASQSSDNAIAKTPSKSDKGTNIVNAPTTITKQTQNTSMKVPVRDQDHSIRSYYRSRFAT